MACVRAGSSGRPVLRITYSVMSKITSRQEKNISCSRKTSWIYSVEELSRSVKDNVKEELKKIIIMWLNKCLYHSSSSKPNSSSAIYEILCIFLNPKVHYLFHKSLPLHAILSQMNPAHNLSSSLLEVHFNITLPYIISLYWEKLQKGYQVRTFVSIWV